MGHEIASPHCWAEHALMIRSQADRHSTLSGGGHHDIEYRFESPKHRDGLVLSMNSYVHGKHYEHAQMKTVFHMRQTHMYIEIV